MVKALEQAIGKRVRLYTISGVESYLGTVTAVHEGHITMRDDIHNEEMFIAIRHIESFHLVREPRART